MKEYTVALPCFKGAKGFCHKTIMVHAKNMDEAITIVRHLRPNDNIGDIKEYPLAEKS